MHRILGPGDWSFAVPKSACSHIGDMDAHGPQTGLRRTPNPQLSKSNVPCSQPLMNFSQQLKEPSKPNARPRVRHGQNQSMLMAYTPKPNSKQVSLKVTLTEA